MGLTNKDFSQKIPPKLNQKRQAVTRPLLLNQILYKQQRPIRKTEVQSKGQKPALTDDNIVANTSDH